MKKHHKVRTAQLVTTFGIGSMIIKNGISFIIAGCDAWYPDNDRDGRFESHFDAGEFTIREPRLEARTEVQEFRQPPDFRPARRHHGSGEFVPNTELTVPILRFPQWHFCQFCGLMEKLPLTQNGKVFCRACLVGKHGKIHNELTQMPFVGICAKGHLQDLPYREWVHRSHHPICAGDLSYRHTGGGTLAGQKIHCSCGAERSLMNIDKATDDATFLSFNLSKKDGLFFCRGHQPWLGKTTDSTCDAYLPGNPKNAGNVFFSQIVSSIYVPRDEDTKRSELIEFLARPQIASKIKEFRNLELSDISRIIRTFYPDISCEYGDELINAVLAEILKSEAISSALSENSTPFIDDSEPAPTEITEDEFRYAEYQFLRTSITTDSLITRPVEISSSPNNLGQFFSRIVQVPRLRETRAFTGFARIRSDNAPPLDERKAMLRAGAQSSNIKNNGQLTQWLPATTVYGEGLYLELCQNRIAGWLSNNGIIMRRHLMPLQTAITHSRCVMSNSSSTNLSLISPVYILLHTLSHMLIKQMSFESGYSAAALRERLYFSENNQRKMAGLLVYTADGDSEGSLGGLVQLGTPEKLQRLLTQALNNARWCSLDPSCSETGVMSGQGLNNSNLAGCFACSHLPETSCEGFNQFLDRSLLVNLPSSKIQGYFEMKSGI